MSGAITNRLKKMLSEIISQSQSGFIFGRQLSDNTRLIYDLMNKTEKSNLVGLLM